MGLSSGQLPAIPACHLHPTCPHTAAMPPPIHSCPPHHQIQSLWQLSTIAAASCDTAGRLSCSPPPPSMTIPPAIPWPHLSAHLLHPPGLAWTSMNTLLLWDFNMFFHIGWL